MAIDLSAHMIARAQSRLDRRGVQNVMLCRMDAARLAFPDAQFDAVYAPYVITSGDSPVHAGVAPTLQRRCTT